MKKLVKVVKVPGRLVQLEVERDCTAKELFEMANITVDEGMVINSGTQRIDINDIVTSDMLVAAAKIKGNASRLVKVVKVPGRVVQLSLEDRDYTAKELFEMAEITVDDSMTINAGTQRIDIDDIMSADMLVASAKIKGNGIVYSLRDWVDENDLMICDLPLLLRNKQVEIVSNEDIFEDIMIIKTIETEEEVSLNCELFEDLFEQSSFVEDEIDEDFKFDLCDENDSAVAVSQNVVKVETKDAKETLNQIIENKLNEITAHEMYIKEAKDLIESIRKVLNLL